ncbi:glycerol-3-phosphate 1-O-acyltransferase PlsY [Fibrella sp. WM1]|uniref:glycerol-3-phosphate 1-O-acyltransferase PlsY n=1 Tax=Fibrella musci TaxID=3242485 RepID=UPI00352270C0
MTLLIVGATVMAYLLGSIPTAVWYGRAFFNLDIRQHGSGNAGATNTFRVLGKRAGTIVLLVDALKGYAAASLAFFVNTLYPLSDNELLSYQLLFGFLAVVGHLYPLFAQFRGGKGVATLLGMVLAIRPDVAAVCIGIWLVVVIASQFVSLGSLLAALAFPVLLLLRVFGQPENPMLIGFGFLIFLIVAITHKKNIGRLIQGNENRTILIKLKKK